MSIVIYISKDNTRPIRSELFIRVALENYFDLPGYVPEIARDIFGKPMLKDRPDIHFNISHTKNAIVCAVSEFSVGIDLERLRKINKSLVRRFFTRNEQEYVFSGEDCQDERFTQIWTMKEAYIKRIGKGLSIPLDSFDVLEQSGIYFFRYFGYYISICSDCVIPGEILRIQPGCN